MAEKTAQPALKDSSWVDQIQEILQNNLTDLFEKVFNSVQATLYNGVAYTIIYLIILIWLTNRLKTGYPTRDDMFKATKWILSVCFVYGVFYSYNGYSNLISWFAIPAQWVKAGVSSIFNTDGNSFGEIVTNAINNVTFTQEKLYNKGLEINKGSMIKPELVSIIQTFFGMISFYIFKIIFWVVMIGVCAIIYASTFMALLILAMAPLLIPFLVVKNLTPYFFSWLKLFISYSLYAPLAFIILGIAMIPTSKLKDIQNNPKLIDELYNSQVQYFLVPTLTSILCIYLLTQIPNWVSQVVGVNGLSKGGSDGAVGALSQAGQSGAMGLKPHTPF